MKDIYTEITNKLIAKLETITAPWELPWYKEGGALDSYNAVTRKAYRGINPFILAWEKLAHGYECNAWMTYKQAQALEGHVKKGEKATMIVFWQPVERIDKDTQEKTNGLICREYYVFNVEQTTLDVSKYQPVPIPKLEGERLASVDLFFKEINGLNIQHSDKNRAFYSPSVDLVNMPPFENFKSVSGFYSTLAHEVTHWTGHQSRLDRFKCYGDRFGSETYAFEELVAELGAAFLCHYLGVANEPRDDHAQYLKNWLNVLKSDKKAIFTASSKAQAAMDYLTKEKEEQEEHE